MQSCNYNKKQDKNACIIIISCSIDSALHEWFVPGTHVIMHCEYSGYRVQRDVMLFSHSLQGTRRQHLENMENLVLPLQLPAAREIN